MSYRRILGELLQKCDRRVDRIHEQYCETFQKKFQKYEDILVQNFEASKSPEDEEKLMKYRAARDEHYGRIKVEIQEKMSTAWREYMAIPHSEKLVQNASDALMVHKSHAFQQWAALQALEKVGGDIENLEKFIETHKLEFSS